MTRRPTPSPRNVVVAVVGLPSAAAIALGLLALARPALAGTVPGAGIDVIAYRLALTPAIADKSVAGRETITFRPAVDGLLEIDFTGNALTIDTATLDGAPVTVKATHDVLSFQSAKPLSRGRTATLVVTYHGKPARGFAGTATSLYTSYFACDCRSGMPPAAWCGRRTSAPGSTLAG